MAGRDKESVLVAFDELGGKPSPEGRPGPRDCGDIGLKIGRDGTWSYRGSPIHRKPLVKLFASVLRREDDGRYVLVTPAERVSIAVEGVPFLAVSMEVAGSGSGQRLTFRTNLDEIVEAGPAHPLSFRTEEDGSFTPFILVRDRLKARLVRPVYYELVALTLEEGKTGTLGVWSGGAFFPFPDLEASGKA